MASELPLSQVDVIGLSPTIPTPSSVNRKRKVTPSWESSASNRCLIVAPPSLVPDATTIDFADSQLFQSWKHFFHSGEAVVIERTSLKLPRAQEPERSERQSSKELFSEAVTNCRHIILNFNLRENPSDFFKDSCSELLNQLFPDTISVSFDGHFLLFYMKSLPTLPRPRTVAGVQAYFTTDPLDEGPMPQLQRWGAACVKIRKDVDCRKDLAKLELLFDIITDYFNSTNTSITEMQYWEDFVIIVLEHRQADLNCVPSEIAHCPCYYLFEEDMGRPIELDFPTRRLIEPTGDIAQYETLRPGVMLSSKRHAKQGVEVLASSGVLLKDKLGTKYVTVASSSFPLETCVFHPVSEAGETEVGTVMKELSPHIGVSLVQPHLDVHFVNECFENSLGEDTPVRLHGIEKSANTPFGSPVYINNPFTGYSEGTIGPWGRMRVTNDDLKEPTQQWIRTRWVYLGQGFSQHMVDGVCGSPLWNQTGNVVGLFRYAPKWGHFLDWGLSVAGDLLIDGGYSIA